MTILGPEVMLASSSNGMPPGQLLAQLLREGEWWTEIKLDGIRAVLTRDRGVVTITNRRRADVSFRYPDVVAAWSEMKFTGVLDGEIIVMRDGRPEFEGAHLRDAQSHAGKIRAVMASNPATFVPFDILTDRHRDVRALAYVQRRLILMNLGVPNVSVASQDGEEMWRFVLLKKLEGLVAKRGDSAYRPGRQTTWRKLKHTKHLSALVGAVVPGKGSRGPVGALELYLVDPEAGRLVSIGSVGSGMRDSDLRALSARLGAKLPTVVEVEYLNVSSSGQLRMPVFRKIELETDPTDCTVDQLHV